MTELSIRAMISARSEELRGVSELSLTRVSDILVELNSLNASLGAELADKEVWYKEKLRMCREEHKSAADAKIYAEASPEWKAWRERKGMWDSLQEVIKSCKLYLRIRSEEYRQT